MITASMHWIGKTIASIYKSVKLTFHYRICLFFEVNVNHMKKKNKCAYNRYVAIVGFLFCASNVQ